MNKYHPVGHYPALLFPYSHSHSHHHNHHTHTIHIGHLDTDIYLLLLLFDLQEPRSSIFIRHSLE